MYASKALEIQGSPGSESPGLSAVAWRLSTVALLKTAIFSWISNAFEAYISAHIGIASNFNTRGKYVVPPYSISFKKYVFTSGSQCVSLSWTLESAQPMSVRMRVIPMGWPAGVFSCGRASRACLPIRLASINASGGISSSPITPTFSPSAHETAALLAMAYLNSPLNQKHRTSQFLQKPSMNSCTTYSGHSEWVLKYSSRIPGFSSHSCTEGFLKPADPKPYDCFVTNCCQPLALIS